MRLRVFSAAKTHASHFSPSGRISARLADDRWGKGASLFRRGKSEHHKAACRAKRAGAHGASRARRKVSQKTNRPRRESRVRVKRRGKSPPPGAQAPGHDKPHAVQDITGSTGRLPAAPERGSFRVLVASALREGRGGPLRRAERNDHHPARATAPGQNSAYRQPPIGGALREEGVPAFYGRGSCRALCALPARCDSFAFPPP